MQVEGGFLDGLDLHFENGLNVLIGGRGTGKSSVIELIRYAMDVRGSSDEEDAKRSREQALSVLQDGQVTLSLQDSGSDFVISRSANADPEGLETGLMRLLIFSQKDVEAVGLSVRGRLNIVDLFSSDSTAQRSNERKRVTQIQSLTTEIGSLLREADQIAERLGGADSVQAELVRAEARAAEVSKTSQQLDQKQKQLEALSTQSASLAVRADALRRALEATTAFRDGISESQLFGFSLDEWPPSGGKVDFLAPARIKLANAEKHIEEAYNLLTAALEDIETAVEAVEREKAPLEEQARTIRRDVEGLKEGAGAAARQLAGLREQTTQLEALKALRVQKAERAARVQKQRRMLLDELDVLREERSGERQRVAQILTDDLAPLIRVKIRQSAQLGEFIGAITNALRGSGLRYNELSPALAAAMTPRELVEAVENYDLAFISKTAKISNDRAERVATQLRAGGTEAIVTIPLDDLADFELLDGADFKVMDELSVGQRCTVVLSILLQHPDRVLIVDQPEDHLDNAFIAQTLIGAIRKRSSHGQLIFSTHNANIPVLGEATLVVRLASNGRRGFVMHAEPLDHPKSVSAITSIMEGGGDAFRTRANFYRRF
jgi:DNA repair exonuclease SbcCD ATPase subunit